MSNNTWTVKTRRVCGSAHQISIEIGSTQEKTIDVHWLLVG